MVEDFKDHPVSLAEVKCDKTRDASDWTPRDALIRLLREIDSGEKAISALVVVYSMDAPDEPGGGVLNWAAATKNRIETLGLLGYAQYAVQGD